MAHHFVVLEFKENITEVPYKYLVELNKLTCIDVHIHIDAKAVQLRHYGYFWEYDDAIEDLFKSNEITEQTIEAYKWFRENTEIYSDCWNVNDNEYGPHNWEQLDKFVKRLKDKYKI